MLLRIFLPIKVRRSDKTKKCLSSVTLKRGVPLPGNHSIDEESKP